MSLASYNTKRDFNQTREPVGNKTRKPEKTLSFVVQRHKATRLHYDFRLEMDGVLKSWAVPKGPSLNPKDKRLAMMVEDHPYEYKDFEGEIPSGNYGAGIVEIWDSGTYTSIEETGSVKKDEQLLKAGLEAGNLKVKLNGKKLKGEFALVRLKSDEDNSWLLIKHNNEFAIHEDYDSENYTPKDSPINKYLSAKQGNKQVKKKT